MKTVREAAKSAAWQRKEGKSPSGGLNRKGVASYRKANPGNNEICKNRHEKYKSFMNNFRSTVNQQNLKF